MIPWMYFPTPWYSSRAWHHLGLAQLGMLIELNLEYTDLSTQ